MIAVPHWSSWNTGISSISSRRSSISKQAGAATSSRLIPPYMEAMLIVASINLSTSVFPSLFETFSSGTGHASTPANDLKRTDLPSITGMEAFAPILPSPRTDVPSVTTATRFPLAVNDQSRLSSCCIALHASATPGVYAKLRSFCEESSFTSSSPILPPR